MRSGDAVAVPHAQVPQALRSTAMSVICKRSSMVWVLTKLDCPRCQQGAPALHASMQQRVVGTLLECWAYTVACMKKGHVGLATLCHCRLYITPIKTPSCRGTVRAHDGVWLHEVLTNLSVQKKRTGAPARTRHFDPDASHNRQTISQLASWVPSHHLKSLAFEHRTPSIMYWYI